MDSAHADQVDAAERELHRRIDRVSDRAERKHFREDTPEWAEKLIDRYVAARRNGVRVCPHLRDAPTQPATWLALLPDFMSCHRPECERLLQVTLEERLGHSLVEEPGRCSACGHKGAVRGVSIGVQETMVRGLLCAQCEAGTNNAQAA